MIPAARDCITCPLLCTMGNHFSAEEGEAEADNTKDQIHQDHECKGKFHQFCTLLGTKEFLLTGRAAKRAKTAGQDAKSFTALRHQLPPLRIFAVL